jgi:hypothetical protein
LSIESTLKKINHLEKATIALLGKDKFEALFFEQPHDIHLQYKFYEMSKMHQALTQKFFSVEKEEDVNNLVNPENAVNGANLQNIEHAGNGENPENPGNLASDRKLIKTMIQRRIDGQSENQLGIQSGIHLESQGTSNNLVISE